jgi:uncharacterized protein (TIGR03118 family)
MKKEDIIFFCCIALASLLIIASVKRENTVSADEIRVNRVNLVEDANLLGGTGLEFGHTGRVWLNTLDGHSIVYNGKGEIVKTKNVEGDYVPLSVSVPGTPTGEIFSPEHAFSKDAFVFVTLEGKIFGWHKGDDGIEPLEATLRVDNASVGAQYTGATTQNFRLYVADNKRNMIEMYDTAYRKIVTKYDFSNPDLKNEYQVYNLKSINDKIYVTYKKDGGGGAVSVFSPDGEYLKTLILDGKLNAPWGLTLSPKIYGDLGQKLLVGNFGDGKINIYDPVSGEFLGTILDQNGNPVYIEGLMALTLGTNNGAGMANELFFSSVGRGKTAYFGKLELIDNHKKNIQNKEKPQNNVLEKEFLSGEKTNISYEDFTKTFFQNCLEEKEICVLNSLNKKKVELDKLYNKMFSDVNILKTEFVAQGLDKEKNTNLDKFVSDLSKTTPKEWLENKKAECRVEANNYFADSALEEASDVCLLFNLQNWLNQLYLLRSVFIRVELGPLGPIQNIQTKAFKDLIDEEENRVQKAY